MLTGISALCHARIRRRSFAHHKVSGSYISKRFDLESQNFARTPIQPYSTPTPDVTYQLLLVDIYRSSKILPAASSRKLVARRFAWLNQFVVFFAVNFVANFSVQRKPSVLDRYSLI